MLGSLAHLGWMAIGVLAGIKVLFIGGMLIVGVIAIIAEFLKNKIGQVK
jgi:hypothetical protein